MAPLRLVAHFEFHIPLNRSVTRFPAALAVFLRKLSTLLPSFLRPFQIALPARLADLNKNRPNLAINLPTPLKNFTKAFLRNLTNLPKYSKNFFLISAQSVLPSPASRSPMVANLLSSPSFASLAASPAICVV